MSGQEPENSANATERPGHLLDVERPTIKILFYTDDPSTITNDERFFGVTSMTTRLHAHEPVSGNFSVSFVSRSSGRNRHADNRINVVLDREVQQTGKPFDEIWFFGTHQITTQLFSPDPFGGGPQSELDAEEVNALETWMAARTGAGGGVLIMGDHSSGLPAGATTIPEPACPQDPPNQFLALGRAIGRCVPRAGLMRTWAGGPTAFDDSTNTVSLGGLQQDRIPQTIMLKPVDAEGRPDPAGLPHPLFFYKLNTFITVLPDHEHEGELVDAFDPSQWPPATNGQHQPLPTVIAQGTNQRNGQRVNLISAYDGDSAEVGRIIADSSWHHYLNVNLLNFPHPSPVNTDSDKIGQFYGNLGLWLAPRDKRLQMAHALLWELTKFTLVMDVGEDVASLGKSAYSLLLRVASPCEAYELAKVLVSEAFPSETAELWTQIRQPIAMETVLGAVIRSYQSELFRSRQSVESYEPLAPAAVVKSGMQTAAKLLPERLGH